ncbi:MAG: hypothetical protein B7X04_00185 [Parcubacteria group bacterium 21-54-25]|nr:MAG: hypothetical protein B7X04_00185 [Parcubacteria group bacterium 21-54-25]HQU07524.1 2'-deoxycytidine 5'-triphosphate deaminase [Candidatus Paceibacterota bacterium]
MSRIGVLPKQMLRELIDNHHVDGIKEEHLNPASIDLPLDDEAYRLESIFLPLRGERIRDLLHLVGATPHNFNNPLEVGVPYLIRVAGKKWELPSVVYGYANPKSSTGRNAFFCRVVADGVDMYDALIGPSWRGEQWVLARPDCIPVLVQPGLAVSQMRFFDGKSFLDNIHAEFAINETGLIFGEDGKKVPLPNARMHSDSFLLTLHVNGGTAHLRKGGFYIMTTVEPVLVPPNFSAELRAIDPRLGEFRSHSAGYIDPGWGYGKSGEAGGRPITLEITPQEDMLVRHGQIIARIRFEHMKEVPEVLYDAAASNYTDQHTARLSKHFKKVDDSDIIGWECRGTRKVLDLSKVNYYEPADFFSPVRAIK